MSKFSKKNLALVKKDVGTLINPSASMLWSQGYYPSATGEPVSSITAIQQATVYACVRAIAGDIASKPIELYANTGARDRKLLRNHPLVRLLKRPNNWQSYFDFMAYLVTCHQLRGNGYVWIRRNDAGEPTSLIPVHPDRMTVMRDLNNPGNLIYQFTSSFFPADVFRVSPDDVIHIRNCFALDDGGVLGVSPIGAGQNVMALALAQDKNAAVQFRQGSMMKGVLKGSGKHSPEQIQRMAASWHAAYSGNENSHKVAFLEEGVEYSPIQMTAVEAQLLEARKFSVNEVCRIFRVPPHKVQGLENATFSNIDSQQQQYLDDCLMPIAVAIEQEFNRKLFFAVEIDHLDFEISFREMLRADKKTQGEYYAQALLNGWMTVNEVRSENGLNPVEGGDVVRVPMNTVNPAAKPTEQTPTVDKPQSESPDDEASDNTEGDDE